MCTLFLCSMSSRNHLFFLSVFCVLAKSLIFFLRAWQLLLVSSMNSLFLARRFSRSLIFSCSCMRGASSGTSAILPQTYSAWRYFFRLAFSRYSSLAIEIIYNLLQRSVRGKHGHTPYRRRSYFCKGSIGFLALRGRGREGLSLEGREDSGRVQQSSIMFYFQGAGGMSLIDQGGSCCRDRSVALGGDRVLVDGGGCGMLAKGSLGIDVGVGSGLMEWCEMMSAGVDLMRSWTGGFGQGRTALDEVQPMRLSKNTNIIPTKKLTNFL